MPVDPRGAGVWRGGGDGVCEGVHMSDAWIIVGVILLLLSILFIGSEIRNAPSLDENERPVKKP